MRIFRKVNHGGHKAAGACNGSLTFSHCLNNGIKLCQINFIGIDFTETYEPVAELGFVGKRILVQHFVSGKVQEIRILALHLVHILGGFFHCFAL